MQSFSSLKLPVVLLESCTLQRSLIVAMAEPRHTQDVQSIIEGTRVSKHADAALAIGEDG